MIKTCVYIYIHIKQWINHTLQVDLDPENLRVVKEDRLGVFVCRIHVRLRGGNATLSGVLRSKKHAECAQIGATDRLDRFAVDKASLWFFSFDGVENNMKTP